MIEPYVSKLLRALRELTSRQFVYEDPWHGYVPTDGDLSEYQIGPPWPFSALHWRDKADVLEFISWEYYREQGLSRRDRDAIRSNVIDGKPPDQWLEGTSFLDPSLKGPQTEKFDRVAADPGKEWDATFGVMVPWEKAHVENKVGFLAMYAAICEVPFEHFARAAEAAVGRPGPGDTWTLRGQYESAWIQFGYGEHPPGYQQLLDGYAGSGGKAAAKGKDDPGIDR